MKLTPENLDEMDCHPGPWSDVPLDQLPPYIRENGGSSSEKHGPPRAGAPTAGSERAAWLRFKGSGAPLT
jgi:hypothetical protein